jgi:putative Mg2+ transporter-C (MgtC) family protein
MDIVQILGWKEVAMRLGSAALIGGLLGLNRELRGKPAGLRTNALVSLGSAILILGSLGVSGSQEPTVEANVVSRVMQGIITGIGFLGAGVILRDTSGARVHGITTAATIWLTATLGMLCGAGVWSVAGLGVGLTLVILILGKPLERFLHRRFPKLSDHEHDDLAPHP